MFPSHPLGFDRHPIVARAHRRDRSVRSDVTVLAQQLHTKRVVVGLESGCHLEVANGARMLPLVLNNAVVVLVTNHMANSDLSARPEVPMGKEGHWTRLVDQFVGKILPGP